MRSPRANDSDVVIELLRSEEWIEEHAAAVGTTIAIDLPEMNVTGELLVTAIEACRPIEPAGSL